jgi:signal transduction histidine kinase/ActR/RegA family two-component response regulator
VERLIRSRELSLWLKILVALAAVGIAFGGRYVLLGGMDSSIPYLTFFPALMIASVLGGVVSGTLATGLSAFLALYFFVEPLGKFSIGNPRDLLGFITFLLSGATMTTIGEISLRRRQQLRKKSLDLQQLNTSLLVEINERKLVEEKLRASQSQLEAALASIPDGMVISDARGTVVNHNEKFARLCKFKDSEEFVQKLKDYPDVFDVFFTTGEPAPLEQWAVPRALRGETATNAEYIIRRKDMDDDWVGSYSFSPILGQDKTITGAVVIIRDITEEKQIARQLVEAKEVAEASSTAKSEFLANMSHEVRTPLNGILGMLQLLATTDQNDEQTQYTRSAIQSTQRLTRLLSDILDISRIEAGKMELIENEFLTMDLQKSILELFRFAAREKGIELDFTLDPALPARLISDETRIRQILVNLTGNAIKFTNTGSVQIHAAPLPHSQPGCARILFRISDTGIGIPDDRLADIFEPFVQVEGSYTRCYQGAGLGLSIVRELVKLLHGELAVDNTPGAGTTFYLSLPFKCGPYCHEPLAPLPELRQPDTMGFHVLLADDDRTSRIAGQRLLEKTGCTVTTAQNGQEVIDILTGGRFDLVLMDVQMPVMDGVESTRRIRTSDAPYAAIPIIAMTAYTMTGDKEKFLTAGMTDYISKPVDISALKEVVGKVMGTRAPG